MYKGSDELNAARYRLMHIHRIKGMTRKIIRDFLRTDPTLESIYNSAPALLSNKYFLPENKANNLYYGLRDSRLIDRLKQDLKRYHVITIVDEAYPPMLRTIKDAPLVLYAAGDPSILKQNPALAVIGTRKPSREASAKLEHIVKPLLDDHWVIVSGMAKGIDGFAHRLSLKHNAKTIAVLGGGFDHIYPQEHYGLFESIAQNGLVISEYPPDIRPAKHHFPERNRIISGLSFGTLVIEAMERSGTMITVEQALDQGRDVFAVPGSPLLAQTKGCHLLIQDGAKLTQHANDIREEWLEQNIMNQFMS